MLESAKVTLDYNEFKTLVSVAEKVSKYEKDILILEESIEDSKERRCLDNIFEILIKAYETKDKSKQELILKAIASYCTIFNIPLEEVIN